MSNKYILIPLTELESVLNASDTTMRDGDLAREKISQWIAECSSVDSDDSDFLLSGLTYQELQIRCLELDQSLRKKAETLSMKVSQMKVFGPQDYVDIFNQIEYMRLNLNLLLATKQAIRDFPDLSQHECSPQSSDS